MGGQAIAEVAVCLPFLILILWGIFHFGNGYLRAQNLELATFYTARVQSLGQNVTGEDWAPRLEHMFGLPPGVEVECVVASPVPETEAVFTDLGVALSQPFSPPPTSAWGVRVTAPYSSTYLSFLDPVTLVADSYLQGDAWTLEQVEGDVILSAHEQALIDRSAEMLTIFDLPHEPIPLSELDN